MSSGRRNDSSSQTSLEERIAALEQRNREVLDGQNELRDSIAEFMRLMTIRMNKRDHPQQVPPVPEVFPQQPQRHVQREVSESEGSEVQSNQEASTEESGGEERQRRGNHWRTFDTKAEIPEFDGKTQGDGFLEWILTVE